MNERDLSNRSESSEKAPLRINLLAVHDSFIQVEQDWEQINEELGRKKIGKKDTPFDEGLRTKMEEGFLRLDYLLGQGMLPFSHESISEMLELNHLIHFGRNSELRTEYSSAIDANFEKFYKRIGPIKEWYKKHDANRESPIKLAAEVYVSILGTPQLFIEGNHRTGSLIADWILLSKGYPPFVLSKDNAISYFIPSSEIKGFANNSTWRGRRKIPEYKKRFGKFLERHIEERYILRQD